MSVSTSRLIVSLCLTMVIALIMSNQFTYIRFMGNKYYTSAEREDQEKLTSPSETANEKIAIALPSIRISDEEESKIDRKIYGGTGDKPHLGGFTAIDYQGLSPRAWKLMVEELGVKSLLDVGCGRGISTSYFMYHSVDVQCVEGSHDAVTQSLLPPERVVEHDFSRGPWWPARTVDAVWCVELLEHIGRQYHVNLFPSFEKAALVFASHSNWGGWHHVEVHSDDWWIAKFQMFGFVYSKYLTEMVRHAASTGMEETLPNGEKFNGQHIFSTMMVFINPKVASLPQHHHLLAEKGCYRGKIEGVHVKRDCGNKEETPLPPSFQPIKIDELNTIKWKNFLMKAIPLDDNKKE
eukprot:CAMPEP_0172516992 /NCGR_PEP_ID=MMETSP1066-20121228/280849_1 /TAXON_ID=671091 /ORGANISM="Coscinodiscus wailesii, Strain CCMP2513" /LENGTH=350 /DNA_ID=CAMNT_0013298729 /DNA_START=136 /DNA_END=1188 /DNA_ORIENTATION=+